MKKLIAFFKEGIWLESNDPRKPIRSFFIRSYRVLYNTWVGFDKDQCSLKASALTFYTLLSMVPVLAVAFGVAKGFGFESQLQRQLLVQFKDNPEVAKFATEFAYSFLKHTEGGIIAGIGIVFLLWTVLKLLNNIETSLNQIWKVSRPRSFIRMVTDYLAILIICPIFIVISSSLTIYISSELRLLAQNESIGTVISPAIYLTFRLIPLVLSWLVLTLIYLIMPNTRVPLSAGLPAGIIAGTVYQLIQWAYIHFQIGVSNYGAIYGSFAALPLFMLWVQVSWLVVLAGAEIAYQIECEKTSGDLAKPRKMTTTRALAVLIACRCANGLKNGQGAIPIYELAHELGISKQEIRDISEHLVASGILVSMLNHVNNEQFMLSYEADKISLADITRSLDSSMHRKISTIGSNELLSVENKLHQWDAAAYDETQNVSILEVLP